jgi:hypothetical protein
MNDRTANLLASYRTRLACLDQPAHAILWKNQPPLVFTTKVTAARAAVDNLAAIAGRQSAPTGGAAADKRREEKELEDTAHAFGRLLVALATDRNDLTTAAKYDVPISTWRALRDEALLQRARLLHADGTALSAGPNAATAATYGVTPASLAVLKKETDDYAAFIVAPQDAIAGRSALTESLPQLLRSTTALFDQLEDFLPQFGTTPAGQSFLAAYLASTAINQRGRGPTPPADPTPPTPPSP